MTLKIWVSDYYDISFAIPKNQNKHSFSFNKEIGREVVALEQIKLQQEYISLFKKQLKI